MGEYVQSDAGTGGAKWGADTITETGDAVSYPRTKLIHGADGVNAGDVCDANPLPVDDAGGSLTVDNAGTFAVQISGDALTALQLIDNIVAVADAVAGATPTGVPPLAVRDDALSSLTPVEGDFIPLRVDANGALWVIASGTIAISAASLPLPTGAATSAKQDTIIGHVDGIETLLTAIDGHVDGVETLLAGGLPAALAAGGGLKVEGVAGGVAVPISVATIPSHAVTNAGTFAVQVDGNALTALQLIDDPVFADDAAFTVATSKVFAVGFLADETATDSVDEGDVGIARMTLDRKQHVVSELESSSMRAAGTALTPKFAIIDAATSGDNTLVAAVASKKVRVLAAYLVSAGTVNVRFEDGAGGTAKSGQMNLVANTGFVLPFNPVGWFETTANTLLNLELSGAISVDGGLVYVEV